MTCELCERLWKDYEDAVFDHVRLNNRHKLAEASGDPAATEQLALEVAHAFSKRNASREALLLHENDSGHGYRAE